MILKLTRRAFNRRLLAFITTSFLSVILATTGFVSFVVSTDAKSSHSGNVEVAQIAEGAMSFYNIQVSNDGCILFEPLEDDDTGRVRNDGVNFENLRITVTGRLSHSEYLDVIKIKLDLPESMFDAEEKGYIVLPKEAREEYVVTDVSTPSAAGDVSFIYVFEFSWGDKFFGRNPSEFFDSELGKEYSDEQMKEMLQELRMLVYGIDDPNIDFKDLPEEAYTYLINLIAYVN